VVLLVGCAAPGSDVTQPDIPRVFPPEPAPARYVFERSVYGADALMAKSQGSGFLNALIGARGQGSEGAGLRRPLALAVHQGRLAVANALDPMVSVFDFTKHQFSKIDLSATGSPRTPVGLCVDGYGNLFVADAMTGSITVFDGQGQLQRRLGGLRWFGRLANITVDTDRQLLFGIDQTEGLHRVRVFNSANGNHVADIGESGDGPGQFNTPQDLVVGKEGRLYVVDSGNFRVQIFDFAGKFISSFGTAGKRPGQFQRPKEIAVDAEGLVHVVDASHGNIQVFDPAGEFLYVIGSRGDQGAPATYLLPSGIAIDVDGRLYVADQGYGKVDIYRSVRHRRAAQAAPALEPNLSLPPFRK